MTGKANLVWHAGTVTAEERQILLAQKPITIWLTGLSGAGKSTLAVALERRLVTEGRACYILDGDNVRFGLNKNLGFSPDDRRENIRRVAEVAKLMNDAGLIVITAFISPYQTDRAAARQIIGEARFFEVYLSTPLSVCEGRDPKGFYRRARQGGVLQFTGIDAPYEKPCSPDLIIDTSVRALHDCSADITDVIKRLIIR